MEITFKWDESDIDQLRTIVREEVVAALKEHGTGKKKPTPKADALEAKIQEVLDTAAKSPEAKVEITDEDLPENMREPADGELKTADGHVYSKGSGYTQAPGSQLPIPNKDRPITPEDKHEFGPRVRALALAPGVLKEWIRRETGFDDPWAIGYLRFRTMLDLFEQKKGEGNEAIAKFITGV